MKREATEEYIPFSYTLTAPNLKMPIYDGCGVKWLILEKGTEKFERWEISVNKIRSALFQMRERILKTKLCQSSLLKEEGFHIYLKRELDQIMNSIQTRGVIYTLLQLTTEQKLKGVVAISTGSFAQTLCYFAKKFAIPLTVVMPTSTAAEIVDKCRVFKARVVVQDGNILQMHKTALNIAKTQGLFYLDGNHHPNMVIGQATLGIEILEQTYIEKLDAVILPTTIHGCGLTAGIAFVIKGCDPSVEIIEVQTEVKNPLVQDIRKTFCQRELNVQMRFYVGHNFNGIPSYLFDREITVSETFIQQAAKILLNEHASDYQAAIGLAAILAGKLNDLKGKKVLIPLFGKMDTSNPLAVNESNSQPGPSKSSS